MTPFQQKIGLVITTMTVSLFLGCSFKQVNEGSQQWVTAPDRWVKKRKLDKPIPFLDELGLRYEVFARTRSADDGIVTTPAQDFGPRAVTNEFVNAQIFGVNVLACEALRAHFSGGRSQIECDSSLRDYHLSDFLDPAIQAMVDTIETTKEEYQIERTIRENLNQESQVELMEPGENCWAAAYEVARLGSMTGKQVSAIAGASDASNGIAFRTWETGGTGPQLGSLLASTKYAQPVQDSAEMQEWQGRLGKNIEEFIRRIEAIPESIDVAGRLKSIFTGAQELAGKMPDPSANPNLRPGDLLLVGPIEEPVHAAIFIAPGIYFERTQGNTRLWGGGNRLTTSDEIVRVYVAIALRLFSADERR